MKKRVGVTTNGQVGFEDGQIRLSKKKPGKPNKTGRHERKSSRQKKKHSGSSRAGYPIDPQIRDGAVMSAVMVSSWQLVDLISWSRARPMATEISRSKSLRTSLIDTRDTL